MNEIRRKAYEEFYAGQGYTPRRIANAMKKKEEKEWAERNQKPVKSMTITIEWKKSRTWGAIPHAEARVEFTDGTWDSSPDFTASGCGYDKESTVIAHVFNHYLKYLLWGMEEQAAELKEKGAVPYGVRLGVNDLDGVYYDGGIGTPCYYAIAEFIGGEFKNTASGKSFGVFTFTMKPAKCSVAGCHNQAFINGLCRMHGFPKAADQNGQEA